MLKFLWIFEDKAKKVEFKYKKAKTFEISAISIYYSIENHGLNQIPMSLYN